MIDEEELEQEQGHPLSYTSVVSVRRMTQRSGIKTYEKTTSKLNTPEGFKKTRYDAKGRDTKGNATRIIYPDDLKPGEELPIVMMVPGDNGNSNFRNSYFNNYEKVNGEPLPRAIYVVAGPYANETENNNAYKDVMKFLGTLKDENGNKLNITASQIGIEAFSGGGKKGMMLADIAADSGVPVVLLLNDATVSERNLAKHKNLSVVYAYSHENKLAGGNRINSKDNWNKLLQSMSDRAYTIRWSSKQGGTLSHGGANLNSQYYNLLLSIMGLTTTFTEEKNPYRVEGMSKKEFIEKICTVANDSIELSDYLAEFQNTLNDFAADRDTKVGGNDLIDIENSMTSDLVNSVADLSTLLSLDAAMIASVGKSFEGMDERLKNILNDPSFGNLFSDFDVPDNLKRNQEDPIIVDYDEVPSSSEPLGSSPNNGQITSLKGNVAGGGSGANTSSEQPLSAGVYLLGQNSDGSNVVVEYDGNKITNMVYQYNFYSDSEAESIKNAYDNSNIADKVKIYNKEQIVEVTINKEVYKGKDIYSISNGLY